MSMKSVEVIIYHFNVYLIMKHELTTKEFEDGSGVEFFIDGKLKFSTHYGVEL